MTSSPAPGRQHDFQLQHRPWAATWTPVVTWAMHINTDLGCRHGPQQQHGPRHHHGFRLAAQAIHINVVPGSEFLNLLLEGICCKGVPFLVGTSSPQFQG